MLVLISRWGIWEMKWTCKTIWSPVNIINSLGISIGGCYHRMLHGSGSSSSKTRRRVPSVCYTSIISSWCILGLLRFLWSNTKCCSSRSHSQSNPNPATTCNMACPRCKSWSKSLSTLAGHHSKPFVNDMEHYVHCGMEVHGPGHKLISALRQSKRIIVMLMVLWLVPKNFHKPPWMDDRNITAELGTIRDGWRGEGFG